MGTRNGVLVCVASDGSRSSSKGHLNKAHPHSTPFLSIQEYAYLYFGPPTPFLSILGSASESD